MAAAIAALSAIPAQSEELRYVLTPKFDAGRLSVELVWSTSGRKRSVLGISEQVGPVQNLAGLLANVFVEGANAERDGALWILRHAEGAQIRCTYEVAPPVKSFADWNATHLPITTSRFFHGLGGAFLLTPQKASGMPGDYETVLRWQLPAGQDAVCSWGGGRSVGRRIAVDDLRTSVYLAGRLQIERFEQDGRRVLVAMGGDCGFEPQAFAEMTQAIIAEQCRFLNETEFPEFVVTAIPAGPPLREGESRLAGSGLYHSFALWVAPGSSLNDSIEHLFAHELFHHWNGRMLAAEQPERLAYWWIEGITDYYALRILYESGRWDAATYAKWLNKHLREYALNPARAATNEEIHERYWSDRDTFGQVAYQRGLLLGLRWQALARQHKSADGLDPLLRALLDRARSGPFLLTNARIREVGAQRLGQWFGAEFDRHVTQATPVELPPDVLAPDLRLEATSVHAFELGFERDRSLRQKKVRGLIAGSEAANAGLRERDELLGWQIPSSPDEPAVLQVRRGDRTETIRYFPRGPATPAMRFVAADDAQRKP